MATETMDFLTALASRNGLAAGWTSPAVVQPRIPSRFEPIAPDAGTGLIESASEMDATREERRIAPSREVAPANAPPTPTLAPALNPSPAQPAMPALPASHLTLRVIERVVHAHETQTIRVVERAQPATLPTVPAMLRDEVTATPLATSAPAQPAIAAAQPQPIQQASSRIVQPPVTAKPSAAQTSKQPKATQQPTDVHINIGRIEVRATVGKKGEPARSRPPAPDLERYLNTLSGVGNAGNSGGEG